MTPSRMDRIVPSIAQKYAIEYTHAPTTEVERRLADGHLLVAGPTLTPSLRCPDSRTRQLRALSASGDCDVCHQPFAITGEDAATFLRLFTDAGGVFILRKKGL